MSISRHFKCRGCEHVWQGPWDPDGNEKGRCPKCGSAKVRPLTHPESTILEIERLERQRATRVDSSNRFEVVAIGGSVSFRCPWQDDQTVMPREQALNLAAWLALMADPTGKEFERIGKEIQNT